MIDSKKNKIRIVRRPVRYGAGYRNPGLCLFIMIGIIIASVVGCNSGDGKKKVDLNDRVSDSELRSLSVQQDTDVLVFGFQLRRSP
ncbi:MAG: hypothetical protein U9R56_05805, partial [candidate division Zixibacteria bacterium]|nr:hypothetical protein [candidate division Zixibacteria bacterium]